MNSAEVALANAVGRLATAHERVANAAVIRNRAEAHKTVVLERLATALASTADGLLAMAEALATTPVEYVEAPEVPPVDLADQTMRDEYGWNARGGL